VKCGSTARDWAYNHIEPDPAAMVDSGGLVYSDDPSFYIPMCRPCHRQFDLGQTCPAGHLYEGQNLTYRSDGSRACRACAAAYAREYRKTPVGQRNTKEAGARRKARYIPKPPRPEVTHCPQGHPYEGYNLIIDGGKKKCRECGRERMRRYYYAHRPGKDS